MSTTQLQELIARVTSEKRAKREAAAQKGPRQRRKLELLADNARLKRRCIELERLVANLISVCSVESVSRAAAQALAEMGQTTAVSDE